jgi:peptidoglycan hydrolase-like protein with peptidoglycan-binding domain
VLLAAAVCEGVMSRFLVMPAVGSCISTSTLPTGAAGPIAISKPVGQGFLARNLADDVKIIQAALNAVTVNGHVGGPIPFLSVDGIKGPKTQAAINTFQRLQVKMITPDGVVEPGKKTILRLNELVAPLSKFDLNAKLAVSLPLVRAGLAAAVSNVTAVITSDPDMPGPAAAVAADRLNRHFRLGTLGASDQSDGRLNLFETYSEMALVVNQPDLFGMFGAIEAFDLDPGNAKIALVTVKGVFEPPLKDGADNPARHIRLGLGFFAPNVTPDFAAFILIHELSHFTSRRDGQVIDDHGRGWFNDTFIKPLPARKRLLNADCYASFAHECRTNSAARPPFVKTAPGGLGGAR